MVTAAAPSEVAGSPRSDADKGGDPLRRTQHWCIVLGSFSLTISYRPSPPMPTREHKPTSGKEAGGSCLGAPQSEIALKSGSSKGVTVEEAGSCASTFPCRASGAAGERGESSAP